MRMRAGPEQRRQDGQWVVSGRRQTIYAKVGLSVRDRVSAARELAR
jgi:hypothetical protein